MPTKPSHISPRELLSLARSSATQISAAVANPARFKICRSLLTEKPHRLINSRFAAAIRALGDEERHFWIGTFYTLLLPGQRRRSQAAYFTPPHLANAMVQLLKGEGFDLQRHSVIDPAAGGAAFLSTIASEMRQAGAEPKDILRRLNGIEIDGGLARLAETLIEARTGEEITPGSVVRVKDSLKMKFGTQYDLVVANPPFGRVFSADLPDERWQRVCHPGHINKYALFADLCFRLAKPQGLVALVMPSSFLAGPLYGRLREHIRGAGEVITLASLATRKDIFVDVAQDVSVLVARAGTSHAAERTVSFGTFGAVGKYRAQTTGVLPKLKSAAWANREKTAKRQFGGATLSDYGAVLRAGYFVWNRESARMKAKRGGKLCVPLIWAENIQPGKYCVPAGRRGKATNFVKFEADSTGITRSNAIVIQRTTNNSQKRRIIASRVSPSVVKKHGGFTTENHTIVLTGPNPKTLGLLVWLLNSKAVDDRYRQVSGTASVSVTLLRGIDLPSPQALAEAVERFGQTDEAISAAYQAPSLSRAAVVA